MVFCDWGNNQEETRELVEELGYTKHTKWVKPQATRRFMAMCIASDITADQFKLGSFGGIFFKTLSSGTPTLTYLAEDEVTRVYPEMPPILNARTVEEIREALKDAFDQPEKLQELGKAGRDWIETHHSGMDTVKKQVEQYEIYLNRVGVDA